LGNTTGESLVSCKQLMALGDHLECRGVKSPTTLPRCI
jgi:hypothetical protein